MGANQTRLHFSANGNCNGWGANVCLEGSNTYSGGGYTQANWTSGYTQGTTSITLSSVTGIVTNLTPIVLDGCDTGYTGTTGSATCTGSPEDNSNLYICEVQGTCSTDGSANTSRANRAQEEVVIATSITGSGPYTVTISPGLRNPNWAGISTPEAWWGSKTITTSGVENLLVDTSVDHSESFVLDTGYKLWLSGVASNYSNNYHVKNYITSHNQIQNSYFYWTVNAGTQSYGIGGGNSGDLLLVNNIIQGVTDPLNFDAPCPGCVAAYNFSVNQYDTTLLYLFGMGSLHAAGQSYILWEGNIGDYADLDDVHGSHTMVTQFRNYWNGYESNNGTLPTDNTSAIHLAAYSRYMNVIANVLGTAGYHTTYQCVPATTTTSTCPTGRFHVAYDIGWSSNTQGSLDPGNSPNDMRTAPTLLRWANWDVVTNAARFCGNSSDPDWTSTCASTSEVPTGDPYYPNSIPTKGDTAAGMPALPPSFHYASAPNWWPTGTTAWPPIGPDVSTGNIGECTSGTYKWSLALSSGQCAGGTFTPSVVGAHAVAIPAMACYLNTMSGPPNGTGSILNFNGSTCYGNGPATPTNLTGTVTTNPGS
jgi:hypothetical protein